MKEADIVYIAALDSDSFNYIPEQRNRITIEEHNKENPEDTIPFFTSFGAAEAYCNQLNSM